MRSHQLTDEQLQDICDQAARHAAKKAYVEGNKAGMQEARSPESGLTHRLWLARTWLRMATALDLATAIVGMTTLV